MKEGLTKKESAFIKGLALWMMIYHHRFINPIIWQLNPAFQGHFNFLLGEEFTRIVAWFCKIALSLMAFVSGYGICFVFRKNKETNVGRLIVAEYRQVIKRLIPFYGRFWYAAAIWTVLEIALVGLSIFNLEFLLNYLGLSHTLNGSWWYVLQYVEMMLLAPIMDLYLKKTNLKIDILKWIVPIVIGIFIILIPALRQGFTFIYVISQFQISYMAVFTVGFIVAKWNIFGIIRSWLAKQNLIVHFLICLLGLIAITALRIRLSTFAAYCRTDFFIAPIWILCLCELLEMLPAILEFFGWFSKYPMYIWVMHLTFFHDFFIPVTLITGLALGNYLTIVLMTTGASVILERIEFYFMKFIKGKKQKSL